MAELLFMSCVRNLSAHLFFECPFSRSMWSKIASIYVSSWIAASNGFAEVWLSSYHKGIKSLVILVCWGVLRELSEEFKVLQSDPGSETQARDRALLAPKLSTSSCSIPYETVPGLISLEKSYHQPAVATTDLRCLRCVACTSSPRRVGAPRHCSYALCPPLPLLIRCFPVAPPRLPHAPSLVAAAGCTPVLLRSSAPWPPPSLHLHPFEGKGSCHRLHC
jgi:hypothetical protein